MILSLAPTLFLILAVASPTFSLIINKLFLILDSIDHIIIIFTTNTHLTKSAPLTNTKHDIIKITL